MLQGVDPPPFFFNKAPKIVKPVGQGKSHWQSLYTRDVILFMYTPFAKVGLSFYIKRCITCCYVYKAIVVLVAYWKNLPEGPGLVLVAWPLSCLPFLLLTPTSTRLPPPVPTDILHHCLRARGPVLHSGKRDNGDCSLAAMGRGVKRFIYKAIPSLLWFNCPSTAPLTPPPPSWPCLPQLSSRLQPLKAS